MIQLFRLALFGLLIVTTRATAGYDAAWYRTDYWGGEYPDGFTMTADATIRIRKIPDRDAKRTLKCLLRANATYHPWNEPRVRSDHLQFVTFSRIATYEFRSPYEATVEKYDNHEPLTLKFAKGERWSFLAAIAEDIFLLRAKHALYRGGQDLLVASTEISGGLASLFPDQWLGLICANGETGWLLLKDIPKRGPYGPANSFGYGHAEDGPVRDHKEDP